MLRDDFKKTTPGRSFLYELYENPALICEVNCPQHLTNPVHTELGAFDPSSEADMKKLLKRVPMRQSTDESLLNANYTNDIDQGKEGGAATSTIAVVPKGKSDFVIDKSSDAKITADTDIDIIATKGIDVGIVINPMNVTTPKWTSELISLWICRHPASPDQDVNLTKVHNFRRYGDDRQFEIECTFEGRVRSDVVRNPMKRRLWIHISVLLRCPKYRQILSDANWYWPDIEHKYYECDSDTHGGQEYIVNDRGEMEIVQDDVTRGGAKRSIGRKSTSCLPLPTKDATKTYKTFPMTILTPRSRQHANK